MQLTYSSTLNAAQLGAIIARLQLRGGTLHARWIWPAYSEAAGLASRGRIALRDLDYLDNGIVLRKANLNSNFSFAKITWR